MIEIIYALCQTDEVDTPTKARRLMRDRVENEVGVLYPRDCQLIEYCEILAPLEGIRLKLDFYYWLSKWTNVSQKKRMSSDAEYSGRFYVKEFPGIREKLKNNLFLYPPFDVEDLGWQFRAKSVIITYDARPILRLKHFRPTLQDYFEFGMYFPLFRSQKFLYENVPSYFEKTQYKFGKNNRYGTYIKHITLYKAQLLLNWFHNKNISYYE